MIMKLFLRNLVCLKLNLICYLKNLKFKISLKKVNTRIVTVNKEFFVLEKSGRSHEIEALRKDFKCVWYYAICAFW